MSTLLQDLRYGVQLLWNKRAYSIPVILMLALGIGAFTSVFSVANAVLLNGPVKTDQWVCLWEHRTKTSSLNQISVSMANFRHWRSECSSSFSKGIVWLPWSYAASGEGINNPERVRAAVISPEYEYSQRRGRCRLRDAC